jgi:WD40 repeat protein
MSGVYEWEGPTSPRPQYATPYVALSPDGKFLLVNHGERQLWNLQGKAPVQLGTPEECSFWSEIAFSPAFSPDGKLLAKVEKSIELRNLDSGGPKLQMSLPGQALSLRFSADGRALLGVEFVGRGDVACKSWDLTTKAVKRVPLEGAPDGWFGLMSPDGRTVADFSGHQLSIWSTSTGTRLALYSDLDIDIGLPPRLQYAPDGRHVAVNDKEGCVYLFRLWDDGELGRSISKLDARLRKAPDNVEALMKRGQCYLRQPSSGTDSHFHDGQYRRLTVHKAALAGAGFLPDSQQVVSATRDGALRVWDIESGRETRRLETHAQEEVDCFAVTPNGRSAVTGNADFKLHLRDLASSKELLQLAGHNDKIANVTFSSDGRRIVSASWDGTARLWDVQTARQVSVFRGHDARVLCVALSSDGKLAASCGADHSVRIWDPQTGEEYRCFRTDLDLIRSVVFAADGRRLLTAGSLYTSWWDAETGKTLLNLPSTQGGECAAVSADGKFALTGGFQGAVYLWSLTTGALLRSFQGPDKPVRAVAFAADGRLASSADAEENVRVWRLPLTAEQAVVDVSAAIRLQPRSAKARALRGTCYLRDARYREALADAAEAIRLDANCKDAYRLRAQVYAAGKDTDKAIAELTRVIALDSRDARAL